MSRNRRLFIFLGGVALIAYGFELFNFHLTIDEEWLGGAPDVIWLGSGRWGMYVLNWLLFPVSALPTLPTALGVAGVAAAAVMAMEIWAVPHDVRRYIATALLITYPTHIFLLSFSINSYGYGLGLLLAVGAVGLFRVRSAEAWLGASVCVILALSIYQALLAVTVAVYFARVLLRDGRYLTSRTTKSLKEFLAFGTMLVLAVVAYILVTSLIWWLVPASNEYAKGHISPSIWLHPWAWRQFAELLVHAYSGTAQWFAGFAWAYPLLMAISAVLILRRPVKKGREKRTAWIDVSVAGALLFSPFLLHLVSGPSLPPRVLVALPFVVTVVFLVGYQAGGRRARTTLQIVAVLAVIQGSAIINRLANAGEIAFMLDSQIGSQVVVEIERQRRLAGVEGPLRLAIVGTWQRAPHWLALKVNILGRSFYEHDQGVDHRVTEILRLVGGDLAGPAREDDLATVVKRQAEMPSWPETGSIVVINRIAIVKFGDYNQAQQIRICRVAVGLPDGFCEGPGAR